MSRCSEQKQQMKWEPLPLPVADASVSTPRRTRPPLKQGNEWCKLSPWRRECVHCAENNHPLSSLMPPHWCSRWDKHNSSYPIQSGLSRTNHKAPRFLLTSLRIPEGSPRTGAYSHFPGDAVAAVSTLRVASSAFGAHWLQSLCLPRDADADGDGAMDFPSASQLGAIEWSSLHGERVSYLI